MMGCWKLESQDSGCLGCYDVLFYHLVNNYRLSEWLWCCYLHSKAHIAINVLSTGEGSLLNIQSKSVTPESLSLILLGWTIRGSICIKEEIFLFSEATTPVLWSNQPSPERVPVVLCPPGCTLRMCWAYRQPLMYTLYPPEIKCESGTWIGE